MPASIRLRIDVADDDDGHPLGAIERVVELPQPRRRRIAEDVGFADRQASA